MLKMKYTKLFMYLRISIYNILQISKFSMLENVHTPIAVQKFNTRIFSTQIHKYFFLYRQNIPLINRTSDM